MNNPVIFGLVAGVLMVIMGALLFERDSGEARILFVLGIGFWLLSGYYLISSLITNHRRNQEVKRILDDLHRQGSPTDRRRR